MRMESAVPQNHRTAHSQRKFRSQASDLWTDAATVARRVREERVSRKKIKQGEKVEKLQATVIFPDCSKVGSLQRRVEPLRPRRDLKLHAAMA